MVFLELDMDLVVENAEKPIAVGLGICGADGSPLRRVWVSEDGHA
jgi:hypothetical protein